MRFTVRRSAERGHVDHGWLVARHSFSFADYFDPAHMGFRSLRVINEDRIAPGAGFPTHGHRDMEIFSYLLAGALQHQDSMGNGKVLEPGDVQLMSAGRGVRHSEFNPSATEPAHLLQIWIEPRARGSEPRYSDWQPKGCDAPLALLLSPDGSDGSATIDQDARVWRVRLAAGGRVECPLADGRGAWLQVVRGSLAVRERDGTKAITLTAGDGLSTEAAGAIALTATTDCEALLFDLA